VTLKGDFSQLLDIDHWIRAQSRSRHQTTAVRAGAGSRCPSDGDPCRHDDWGLGPVAGGRLDSAAPTPTMGGGCESKLLGLNACTTFERAPAVEPRLTRSSGQASQRLEMEAPGNRHAAAERSRPHGDGGDGEHDHDDHADQRAPTRYPAASGCRARPRRNDGDGSPYRESQEWHRVWGSWLVLDPPRPVAGSLLHDTEPALLSVAVACLGSRDLDDLNATLESQRCQRLNTPQGPTQSARRPPDQPTTCARRVHLLCCRRLRPRLAAHARSHILRQSAWRRWSGPGA